MRERDYAHRKARKTNKELDWSAYRRLRNRVNMSIRKAKENYSRKVVDENADNPRNFWKIVKSHLSFVEVNAQWLCTQFRGFEDVEME